MWHIELTIWTETLESTAFVALRYVDTDAGVATRAGVATVTLLTVGTHVARATLALVPILCRVNTCHNNINSQLDATVIILLTISISSTCFGR